MCLPGYLAIFPPTPGTKHRKIGFWAAPVASPQPHPCATTCHIRLLDQRLVTGRCFQDICQQKAVSACNGPLDLGYIASYVLVPFAFFGGGGGGLWTEVCGQQKQSNGPHNNQHNPQYANYWALLLFHWLGTSVGFLQSVGLLPALATPRWQGFCSLLEPFPSRNPGKARVV